MVQAEKISFANAASYIDWWAMAGVIYQVGDLPMNWLQDDDVVSNQPKSAEIASTLKPQTPSQLRATDGLAVQSIPDKLLGDNYGGKIAVAVGEFSEKLMIISDLPDPEDIESERLGEGASGKLLRQMVAATGKSFSNCYFTALAHSRPATGDIPEADLPMLAGLVLDQIKMMKPEMIWILGSVACQALLGAELMTARGNLHYFNHDGQKVSAMVTFHPRTLLARPILKAQAWKDMQMFNIKDAL